MAVPTLVSTPQTLISETPIPTDLRKGDLLIGWRPDGGSWPDDWTEIQPGLAWRRYDGIQLDHIPFVWQFRGVADVSLDQDQSPTAVTVSTSPPRNL